MDSERQEEKWHSNDVKIEEDTPFRNMLLSARTLEGLKNCGFETPSPIQYKAIPYGRCGIDLVVQAKSGTGKTCVLTVIALENLKESFQTQTLVLAPTREVAAQISEVIQSIGSAYPNLQCHLFIGGVSVKEQIVKLSNCRIAVGTPGRIRQLIFEGHLKTDAIHLFVLDEADVLLEKSFFDDINWINSQLPHKKQVIALSATYPKLLAQKLSMFMVSPTFVRLNANNPGLLGISQFYRCTTFHPVPDIADIPKFEALLDILNTITFSQCMIFCKQQTRVQDLTENLNEKGFPTSGISSALEQYERLEIIHKLRHFQCRVLVSTDLTSRGIDAENVNLVVNYDMPYDAETYLHRMGRAGRYGTSGIAISLVSGEAEMKQLSSFQEKFHFKVDLLPDPIPVDIWGLIFEKKFQSFVPLKKQDSEVNEEIAPPEKLIGSDCLTTHDVGKINGTVAENNEGNKESGTEKSNLVSANNVDDFNNNCEVPRTLKISKKMENDTNLLGDFNDSDNCSLEQKDVTQQQRLNEILNNENLVQAQKERSSSSYEMEMLHYKDEKKDTIECHIDDVQIKNNSDGNCPSEELHIDVANDNGNQNYQTTTEIVKSTSAENGMVENQEELPQGYTSSKSIFSSSIYDKNLDEWKEYFSSDKSEATCLSDESVIEILSDVFHTFNVKGENVYCTYDELVSELKVGKYVGKNSSNTATEGTAMLTEDISGNHFEDNTDAFMPGHPPVPEKKLDSTIPLTNKDVGIFQTLQKKFSYYDYDAPLSLHKAAVDITNGLMPCRIINRPNVDRPSTSKQIGRKEDQTVKKIVKCKKDQTKREGFAKHEEDMKQKYGKEIPKRRATESSPIPSWQTTSGTTVNKEFPKSSDRGIYVKSLKNRGERRSRQQITTDMHSSYRYQNEVFPSKNVDNTNSASRCHQYQQSKIREETDKYSTRFSTCDSSLPSKRIQSCMKCYEREKKVERRRCCCCYCCCGYSEKRNVHPCCCYFSKYSWTCEALYHSSPMINYRKYLEQQYYLSELSKWHY